MEIASIYSQFHRSLLSFIRSRITVKEDAEDILQNVFMRISENIDRLSEAGKLRSWIYAITRNAIIDYYRRSSIRRHVSVVDGMEDIAVENEADPAQGLDGCLTSMIELLPAQYRDVIMDAEIYGLRQKDLAEKYNIAYPSLRSRVQRGRERLKELLYNCCHIQTDRRGHVVEVRGKDNCGDPCGSCN